MSYVKNEDLKVGESYIISGDLGPNIECIAEDNIVTITALDKASEFDGSEYTQVTGVTFYGTDNDCEDGWWIASTAKFKSIDAS